LQLRGKQLRDLVEARNTIDRGDRNGFLGFVNTMDLLPEAFGIRRGKGCSQLLTPNELLTTL